MFTYDVDEPVAQADSFGVGKDYESAVGAREPDELFPCHLQRPLQCPSLRSRERRVGGKTYLVTGAPHCFVPGRSRKSATFPREHVREPALRPVRPAPEQSEHTVGAQRSRRFRCGARFVDPVHIEDPTTASTLRSRSGSSSAVPVTT